MVLMPTVLRKEGFELMIYTDDHEPAHVHVFKGGGKAKINIWPVEPVRVKDMKPRVVRQAVKIVEAHQDYLLEQWEDIHG